MVLHENPANINSVSCFTSEAIGIAVDYVLHPPFKRSRLHLEVRPTMKFVWLWVECTPPAGPRSIHPRPVKITVSTSEGTGKPATLQQTLKDGGNAIPTIPTPTITVT